jgi:cytochrome c peroxidase
MHVLRVWLTATATLLCASASAAASEPSSAELGALKATYRRPVEIPFPKQNPYTSEKAALGKALYFDPRLSGNQNMNCASCHNPSFGWEAPLRGAIGSQSGALSRNTPTILNQAWNGPYYFWDGRANSLEEQAIGTIQAKAEMKIPPAELVQRLQDITEYNNWFGIVFSGEGVTAANIAKALATYERTVVSGYAPFDAWIEGDEQAISDSAKRGFQLFTGKANCSACHTGWNFSDNKFHDIGLETTDIGRAAIEPDNPQAKYAFKTPSLRDLTQRAQYLHDGSVSDLQSIIAHYLSGGVKRPSVSPQMRRVKLGAEEFADLVEFMKTLTGTKQKVSLPVLPN